MKNHFYIIAFTIIGLIIYSCGNDKPDKLPSSNQRKNKTEKVEENDENDDLLENIGLPINKDSAQIIYTGGTEKDHQFVFIDKRKNSDYYSLIMDFEFPSKFETSQYRNSYATILKHMTETPIIKSTNISLEENWISLKMYDYDYYVYCPAREEENYRFRLTDSSMIIFESHGVIAEKITEFEKETDKHFVLNTITASDKGKLISKEINIYLIDSKKQIYIWEIFAPEGIEYRLMTPVKYAKSFPIIVNYGEKSKPEEYKFKEINYFEEISKLL